MPRRAASSALALAGLTVVNACAGAATWQTLELGEFSLTVPSTMVHEAGGTDSQSGTLQDPQQVLNYDYGAYSDPLKSVSGVPQTSERTGTLGGLPARFVSFTRHNYLGQNQACEGVHVPLVRKSAIGSIKLTLLLCGDAKKVRATADKLFASIKFQADASR